jgi:hypothetical protein
LLLALATLVVYLPAAFFDFVTYDDPLYVYANPHVSTGISPKNVIWAFTSLTGNTSY